MNCKHCKNNNTRKAGWTREIQRYKCLDCKRHFTDTPKRGKSEEIKAFAVHMYVLCNASFRMIGRLLGVSAVAVLKWIRAAALKLERPVPQKNTSSIIIVDEMWHFVNGKKTKFGSGKPLILCQSVLSSGNLVAVMMEH